MIKRSMGKLITIFGCMSAEKSFELNRLMRRHIYGPMFKEIFLFFPLPPFFEKTQENAQRMYKSRTNIPLPGEFRIKGIKESSQILKAITKYPAVIGFDEIQFFEYLPHGEKMRYIIEELLENGNIIYTAGLNTDFRGEPFGSVNDEGLIIPKMPLVAWLSAKADYQEQQYAICQICGDKATRTQRLENNQPSSWFSKTLIIDNKEDKEYVYEPRCTACHVVPDKPQWG